MDIFWINSDGSKRLRRHAVLSQSHVVTLFIHRIPYPVSCRFHPVASEHNLQTPPWWSATDAALPLAPTVAARLPLLVR